MAKFKIFVCYVLIAFSILSLFPKETFALAPDYSKPDFTNQKFIYSRDGEGAHILHKFKFGAYNSEVRYQSPSGSRVYKFDPNRRDSGGGYIINYLLNSERFPNKNFEVLSSEKVHGNLIFNNTFIHLLLIHESDGKMSIGGLYVTTQAGAGFSCQATGAHSGAQLFGIGEAESVGWCMYALSPWENGGQDKNDLILDKNYTKYAYDLSTFLHSNTVATSTGAGSVVMVPDDPNAATKCAKSHLTGPINTNYPEYRQQFVDSLLEQVNEDSDDAKKAKDKLRQLANDSKLTDDEDMKLFTTFYATGTEVGYANKYMDEIYENAVMDVIERYDEDEALDAIWDQRYGVEKLFANTAPSSALEGAATAAGTAAGAKAISYAGARGSLWAASMAFKISGNTSFIAQIGQKILTAGATGTGYASIAAGTIITAAVVIAVALVLIGVALWIYAKARDDSIKAKYHSAMKLFHAHHYVLGNYENQKCTELIKKYPEQESVYQSCKERLEEAIDRAKASAAGDAKEFGDSGECADYKPKGIFDWKNQISSAFCGLALMLRDLANSIFEGAVKTYMQAIGYLS